MLLGKRIKSLRKEKGLTQEELGKMINVTKVSICCYEKETRFPTLETLLALAEVFNVDVNYFFGSDEYLIAEQGENYGVFAAKEEIEFIKEPNGIKNAETIPSTPTAIPTENLPLNIS